MRFLLPLLLALTALPAYAQEVQLVQEAERQVPRDRMTAILRLEVRGNDPRPLQAEINRRVKAALAKAKAQPAVQTSSGSYSVYRAPDPKTPDQWQAAQELFLTSGDLDALLALAGQLQADGLVMSGMHFFVAPATLKFVEDDLTAEAINGLKARAAKVAQDLGARVDSYKTISIGNAGAQNAIVPMRMAKAAAAPNWTPPAAEPGETTVSVTVTATVLMAPR